MRSRASCSASAPRAIPSARTNSTWATRWPTRRWLALDSGHYHPTETIADKLSAVLTFVDEMLLHVSRGVRWDSDHVVTLTDDLQAIAQELVRGDYLGRTHIGLDYFDASINRIAAWVIGTRNMQRALLMALLEPSAHLAELERAAITPAAWRCRRRSRRCPPARSGTPSACSTICRWTQQFMAEIKAYEAAVLAGR